MKTRFLRNLILIVSIIFLLTLTQPLLVQAEPPRVLIVVNSTLRSDITSSINQYVADLEFEGYSTAVDEIAGTATSQDLRALIQSYYNEPERLVGCIMIGQVPVANYEYGYWPEAGIYKYNGVIDLYYMDLNGTWIDSNSNGMFDGHQDGGCGVEEDCDRQPEIWVGRIPSSDYLCETRLGFSSEAACVKNYFAKDHHYRTGQLRANYGALLFADEGKSSGHWDELCGSLWVEMSYYLGYDQESLTQECTDTQKEDYLNALTQGYEHIGLFAHGSTDRHGFYDGYEGPLEEVLSNNIKNTQTSTLFYTSIGCANANYTADKNIASYYILSFGPGSEPSSGLTFLGHTRDIASHTYLMNYFWYPFGTGASWGEAVEYFWLTSIPYDNPADYYYQAFLGDPTLKRSDYTEFGWQGRNVPEWLRRYDGPSNGDDRAKDIWVRGNGNTLTTGYSYDITGGYDMLTQKRDANGELLWEARWNSQNNNNDYAMAIAQTPDKGVFVVGATEGASNGLNWRILKYGNGGVYKWKSTYNGSANKDDRAEDVAVDSSNNVFVAGWSTNADDTKNLVLRKYASTSSIPLWTKTYPVSASISSFVSKPVQVGVDGEGNAYLAGTSNYCLGCLFSDYFLAKYDTYGNRLWERVYDASGGEVELRGLAVDSAGYAYVTGRSTLEGFVQKMCTIKYDPQGNEVWQRCFADDWTFGDAIAVDTSGNVFVSGDSMAGCHTVKYSADGNELWSHTYGSSGTKPNCMTADGNDNVIVAGKQETNVYDYFTIRYDSNGNLQWWSTYDGPGNGHDEATAIGVDNNNNIYVTGYSSSGNPDFATMKYQP